MEVSKECNWYLYKIQQLIPQCTTPNIGWVNTGWDSIRTEKLQCIANLLSDGTECLPFLAMVWGQPRFKSTASQYGSTNLAAFRSVLGSLAQN